MAKIFLCNVDYNINVDKSLFNNVLANKKGNALISSFNASNILLMLIGAKINNFLLIG